MVCLNDAELKQIYDEGQLNKKIKIEQRLGKIRRRVNTLNGIDNEQLSETEDTVPTLQEKIKNVPDGGFAKKESAYESFCPWKDKKASVKESKRNVLLSK